MAVLSNEVYSPQGFVGELTGNFYIFNDDNDIDTIHELLRQNGIETEESPLWDYPLNEIDHIVENKLNVVLVEIGYFDEKDYLQKEFRWFEVPEHMIEKFN